MKKPVILVIDDSLTARMKVKDLLEADGFAVAFAADADEGTAQALALAPDVVVLDVVLPGRDGIELCAEWRTNADLKNTPILLMSGDRSGRDDRVAGLRAGALGYVLKPFCDAEFLAQVGMLVRLNASYRELLQTNTELEEFTYVASHDLQEPLRKLVSFSKLLCTDAGDSLPEGARRDLDFITDAATRMQTLVQDLLEYSRVGRTEKRQESVALDQCVDRALDALAARLDETGAEISRDALPEVQGDAVLLTQLYQNLIGNAVKYSDPDRRPVVRLTAVPRQGEWMLGVQDNGIGIKPEYVEQVFAPFKRLHGRSQYEGTGIGLAICSKVVRRHGGRIWVESEPGVGSHFKFTLREAGEPDCACVEAGAGAVPEQQELVT